MRERRKNGTKIERNRKKMRGKNKEVQKKGDKKWKYFWGKNGKIVSPAYQPKKKSEKCATPKTNGAVATLKATCTKSIAALRATSQALQRSNLSNNHPSWQFIIKPRP